MDKNTQKILLKLGLSNKQVLVYDVLLKKGSSSAQSIARWAELKRTTVYAILDELIDLSLATQAEGLSKKYYRPLSPHIFIKQKKQTLLSAENILPEIEAMVTKQGLTEKPHVMFFEGVEGIKKIVEYKIEELKDSELREMLLTTDKDTLELFGNFFYEYEEKLKKWGIRERGISPNTPEIAEYNKKYKKDVKNIKIVSPKQWDSNVAIEIGKTWVKIYDLKNLQGIIIQNTAITNALGQMFELSWKGVGK